MIITPSSYYQVVFFCYFLKMFSYLWSVAGVKNFDSVQAMFNKFCNNPGLEYWWVDDPEPALMEQEHYGAKTINQWREDYLWDFARRMDRCMGS